MKKNIAIITARGGSKRIPRKNIKNFLGKPIIAYAIEVALKSGLFPEVMVSTDDDEIAKISESLGASIPFIRSPENSNDHAGTTDVILEVLGEYERLKHIFDFACCIYPTAVFTTQAKLIEGFNAVTKKGFDTAFPIVKYSTPIYRSLQVTEGRVSMIWPDNLTRRSQDFPNAFHDAGQFYWVNVNKFMSSKKLWTNNSFGLEISELHAQDIDNPEDWRLAELKYKLMSEQVIDFHF